MLFYMAGTVIWSYFAACLTKTSNTFIANAGIFGKVYFPRLTVPLSILISNLVAFAIGRIYGLGEASGKNKASKRSLTQAKRRCSKWLKPSSL
jgi:hypothetical protein